MANMSYCRFENTLSDLRDCMEILEGNNNGIDSEREKKKALKMLNLMVDFLSGEGIIDNVPDDCSERIQEMIDSCCNRDDN